MILRLVKREIIGNQVEARVIKEVNLSTQQIDGLIKKYTSVKVEEKLRSIRIKHNLALVL